MPLLDKIDANTKQNLADKLDSKLDVENCPFIMSATMYRSSVTAGLFVYGSSPQTISRSSRQNIASLDPGLVKASLLVVAVVRFLEQPKSTRGILKKYQFPFLVDW